VVDVESGGLVTPYVLPVAVASGRALQVLTERHPEAIISPVRSERGRGMLYDATVSERFTRALIELMADERVVTGTNAQLHGVALEPFTPAYEAMPELLTAQRLSTEQSNTSIRVGEQLMLKLLRRLEPAPHPEVTLGRHLNRWPELAPRLAGVLSLTGAGVDGGEAPIAVAHELVLGRQDGWAETLSACRLFLDEHQVENPPALSEIDGAPPEYAEFVRTIGERTALLHRALATPRGNPEFEPQPLARADLDGLVERIQARVASATPALEAIANGDDELLAEQARTVLRLRNAGAALRDLATPIEGLTKTHVHGDYHLGQLLASDDAFYILDFGGAVGEPIEERRELQSPLTDVAGMLRSFSYAGHVAGLAEAETIADNEVSRLRLETAVLWWIESASAAFLDAYFTESEGASFVPDDPEARARLLRLFLIDTALHEFAYESQYRPAWVHIPLGDLARLVQRLEADREP
jgi:maltose alpha-D-glucosyltransferase/alpha-amylase